MHPLGTTHAFACMIEVVTDAAAANASIARNVAAMQTAVSSAATRVNARTADPIVVPTEQGIVVVVFDDGKLLFDMVAESLSRISANDSSLAAKQVRCGLDYIASPGFVRSDSTDIMTVAAVVARLERLVSFGEVGHVLMSDDYYQTVMVGGPLAKYVHSIGRYQGQGEYPVHIWSYFDGQIGNETPPEGGRIEDESGTSIYAAPYFKLCQPRLASPERMRELATREVKVLALSPHPNDIPWGCAGTLMWLKKSFNARIYLHFLTSTRSAHVTGDPRYGPPSRALGPALWSYGILTGQDPSSLLAEVVPLPTEEAYHVIAGKIPRLMRTPHQMYIEGYMLDPMLDKPPLPPEGMFSDGNLDKYPSVLRDRLLWLQGQIGPDIVLCPSLKDIHQDHRATAEAAVTVFKFQESIWFYELPQASHNPFYYFSPTLFVDVTPYAGQKLSLLSTCFEHDIKRFHFSPDGARSLMQVRAIEGYYERSLTSVGGIAEAPHVEAFEARLYLR